MTPSEAASNDGIHYALAHARANYLYNYQLVNKLPDEILRIADESIQATEDPQTQFIWEIVKCKVEADLKRGGK